FGSLTLTSGPYRAIIFRASRRSTPANQQLLSGKTERQPKMQPGKTGTPMLPPFLRRKYNCPGRLFLKLAEALAERSDCQNRIAEVNKRLARSARVQEGEQPPEDPVTLLAELDRFYVRLLELVQAINRTNARTQLDGRFNISDGIAERDLAGKKRDHLAALAEAASTRQDRYSKSEVKFVSTLPIADLQKQADQLSRRYRELDTQIQELNWKTELA